MKNNVEDDLTPIIRETETSDGVQFDAEEITLLGHYSDEISLYRARKNWTEILETNFLLDRESDYFFQAKSEIDSGNFMLQCKFMSACGRYAFWRLINNQAPEAQYMIETAHIPQATSRQDDFLSAPDMKSIDSFLYSQEINNNSAKTKNRMLELLENAIDAVKNLGK